MTPDDDKQIDVLARELAAAMIADAAASLRTYLERQADRGLGHVVELHAGTVRVLEGLLEQLVGRRL